MFECQYSNYGILIVGHLVYKERSSFGLALISAMIVSCSGNIQLVPSWVRRDIVF